MTTRYGVPYSPFDWFLFAATILMTGTAFFLVKVALEDFSFEVVAWLRIVFGAVVLGLIPKARRPLKKKRDWIHIVILATVWVAVPFTLTARAQESIVSGLAGMLSGTVPILTATIAAIWFREKLYPMLILGFIFGFIGVVVLAIPNYGDSSEMLGIILTLAAAVCYAIAYNLIVPIQERNSTLPVIWRTILVAAVLMTPFGILGLEPVQPQLSSIAALVLVGTLSSGLAFATYALLAMRVGSTRSSVYVYFVPVCALVLGVLFAGEELHLIAIVGVALILIGAYVGTRVSKKPSLSE